MGYKDKYYAYLKSKEWLQKRQERLEIDDWECAWCGKHNCSLHVHHLTYDRLFNENVETDLITLGKRCHHYGDLIRKQIKRIDGKHGHRCFVLDKLLYLYGYPYNMKSDNRAHVRKLHKYLVNIERIDK